MCRRRVSTNRNPYTPDGVGHDVPVRSGPLKTDRQMVHNHRTTLVSGQKPIVPKNIAALGFDMEPGSSGIQRVAGMLEKR